MIVNALIDYVFALKYLTTFSDEIFSFSCYAVFNLKFTGLIFVLCIFVFINFF